MSFVPEILRLRIPGIKIHKFEQLSLAVHRKSYKAQTQCWPVTLSDSTPILGEVCLDLLQEEGLVWVAQVSGGLFPVPSAALLCPRMWEHARNWLSHRGPRTEDHITTQPKMMPEFAVHHEVPPGFVWALQRAHGDGFIQFQTDPVPFSGLEGVPCGKGWILQSWAVRMRCATSSSKGLCWGCSEVCWDPHRSWKINDPLCQDRPGHRKPAPLSFRVIWTAIGSKCFFLLS